MADVANKQQTTDLFLSTTVTRTQESTQNWQTSWETCAEPEFNQFSFSWRFLHS